LPLQLPNLDDLRWKDLVEEGRSLIPAAAKTWTNHNPSDPGITLIELFAFVSGTLMYQLNRITEADTQHFLRLLKGVDKDCGKQQAAQDEQVPVNMRTTLRAAANADEKRQAFRSRLLPERAVTAEDYELLVTTLPGIARAKCLPDRNLENEDPQSRWLEMPGHVSVVVLPKNDPDPSPRLLAEVRQELEPARLLTTRVHAVPPHRLTVGVQLTIVAARQTAAGHALRDEVAGKLRQFLDPYRGWLDQRGWPLGRNLYISELYELVAGIPGVESVSAGRDAQGVSQDEIKVDPALSGRLIRDTKGRVQALALLPDELIHPQIEAADIEIAKHHW
jgi:Baseplate J-like protein